MRKINGELEDAPTQVIPPEVLSDLTTLVIAGRYEVVRKLGRGGFGIVYLARDRRLGRQIAIKVLSESCDPGSTDADRFLREAKTLASLDHVNIVPIYDANLDGDHLYIAMKYVPGQPLSATIRERPLPEADALRIVGKVAAGLDHAHQRGVLHRDVKPSNVLLDEEGHVYLVDFGLSISRLHDAQSAIDQVAGSLPYMAPEALSGEAEETSDVYALGTVLYEMLFREPCFRCESTPALVNKVLHEDPPLLARPPRAVGAPCSSLLRRLLHKAPGARPESAAKVIEEVEAVLAASTRTSVRAIGGAPSSGEDPGAPLEPSEKALGSLIEQCERQHPRIDKVIECFSSFLAHAGALIEVLDRTFKARPEDASCQILTLSLYHLAREARERIETVHGEGGREGTMEGAVVQLEARILTPARQLLRKLEDKKDAHKPPLEEFFSFDEDPCSPEAPQEAEWVDHLFSRKEIDRYEAILTVVGTGRDAFVAELAARPEETRDALLDVLWKHADILLLEGRGRAKPIFKAAIDLAAGEELATKWRQLFSLFQNTGSGYWDADMVRQILQQKEDEDRRTFARALLMHPWTEYRRIALELLDPRDCWHMIAHERTPVASILELWRHLKPRVKQHYLKIFFVSVQDRLRQPGDAQRALVSVELVKEFYAVDAFHESFFFKTLTSLEKAVNEEAQRHRYPIDLDKEYVAQMREFLKRKATQDQPVQGWAHVPLPVQRTLARRGHFQNHFSCHPIDPIALECLRHVLAREDISGFLKLMNINARLLGEIAKDKLHFRDERAKYLLVANPKTQPFIVAKYVGYLRGDNLRALANSRQCNTYAREHAARLLKKKESVRGFETAARRRGR